MSHINLSDLRKAVSLSSKLLNESMSIIALDDDISILDSVPGTDGAIGYASYHKNGCIKTFAVDVSVEGVCLVSCLHAPIKQFTINVSDPDYPTKVCGFIKDESERRRQ